jgi:hypothetical protein
MQSVAVAIMYRFYTTGHRYTTRYTNQPARQRRSWIRLRSDVLYNTTALTLSTLEKSNLALWHPLKRRRLKGTLDRRKRLRTRRRPRPTLKRNTSMLEVARKNIAISPASNYDTICFSYYRYNEILILYNLIIKKCINNIEANSGDVLSTYHFMTAEWYFILKFKLFNNHIISKKYVKSIRF